MEGIISLLDAESDRFVRQIWSSLEDQFGFVDSQQTLPPHFSWHVAKSYNYTRLKSAINRQIKHLEPFMIQTTGLGIFLEPVPVLYISIVVTSQLLKLHEHIFKSANLICKSPNPYYDPSIWMPHVTLAYKDLDLSRMGDVMDSLNDMNFNRKILVDNFAIVCPSPDGGIEICRMDFQG